MNERLQQEEDALIDIDARVVTHFGKHSMTFFIADGHVAQPLRYQEGGVLYLHDQVVSFSPDGIHALARKTHKFLSREQGYERNGLLRQSENLVFYAMNGWTIPDHLAHAYRSVQPDMDIPDLDTLLLLPKESQLQIKSVLGDCAEEAGPLGERIRIANSIVFSRFVRPEGTPLFATVDTYISGTAEAAELKKTLADYA